MPTPPRLREYAKKRDFQVTPEPPPATPKQTDGAATFMIHKHHARRLHYDLRLEMDGVLASWAVPKGPSYDPADKRLAVQTEDHPLEYGGFEGRIPDDEYGGGDSLVWDRGTYDTVPAGQASQQRKKGRMVIQLDGEKLKGRWNLVRTRPAGGKAQWLLLKAKDGAERKGYDVVTARPESVVSGRRITRGPETARELRAVRIPPDALLKKVFPPMLATLVAEPPADEDDFVLEVKYDGFRALAGLSGGRVALRSRNALDLAGRFPGVAKALEEVLIAEAVIDGEICALDDKGRPRFERMQQSADEGVVFYAFDLLWLDGDDLRGRTLEERRELLESVLGNPPDGVVVAERIDGDARAALARAAREGQEGIIAKRRGSAYAKGRSRDWLKLKAHQSQELAVVGYSPLDGKPHHVGALLVAAAERPGGPLVFAGKVGTGFSAKVRRELGQTLDRDVVPGAAVEGAPRMRDAVWVTPKLVAQVSFTEWTSDGKLRHPSFQGLRDDKRPEECVRERPQDPPAPKAKARAKGKAKAKPPAEARVEVTLTSPSKLLYPDDGITKRMVADYYEAMSEPLLAALADRPLALEHWPKGIEQPSWFHQNIGREAQPWMDIAVTPTRTQRGSARHLIANRVEALTWLAQMSALTIHMWSSRRGSLDEPDWVVFDLDPADGHGIEQTIEPAHALRRLLEELKLSTVVKTSGKRGLHLFVPLAPGHSHDRAVEFALKIGDAVAGSLEGVTIERAKAARKGRLYLDCLQNGKGKTIVAPYSLRGAPGAPVSAPLAWDEVTRKLDPSKLNLETMPARVAKVGDLFAPALQGRNELPRLG